MRVCRIVLVCLGLMSCAAILAPVQAIPLLQTYIEGAIYNPDSETWETTEGTFDLWVIGNVAQAGPILDVHLVAAYWSEESIYGNWNGLGWIEIEPHDGVPEPVFDRFGPDGYTELARIDGAIPVKEDGRPLSTHGVFGAGVMFDQWELGDFDATSDPIGDYGGGLPTSYPSSGQINKYTVSIHEHPVGGGGIFFDVFNHVEGSTKSTFGPFSHNASASVIPEPATALLLGLGLIGAGGLRVIRRRSQR